MLRRLPLEILLLIFRRMKGSTLSRIRQTSKKIHSIVESHRFMLSSKMAENDWSLVFEIPNMRNPKLEIFVVPGRLNWEFHPCGNAKPYRSKERKRKITAPVNQLSAVRFNSVAVIMEYAWYPEILGLQSKLFHHLLLPITWHLKLKCEYVYTFNCPPLSIKNLLSHVDFASLFTNSFNTYVSISTFLSWPLSNCKRPKIHSFKDVPDRLSLIVRQFSEVKYSFCNSAPFSEKVTTIVNEFILEVRHDLKARGQLESMEIDSYFDEHGDFLKIPGIVRLWEGIPYEHSFRPDDQYGRTFYKLKIDGGLAIITNTTHNCQVRFVNEDNRHILFETLFPSMFASRSPFDASAIYDDFMAEEDESDAFQKMYTRFYDYFVKWSIERGVEDDDLGSDDEDSD